ncbi:MAG: DUF1992 domain-containing protein [Rubrivivax sp.]|nr:DUF1992 domain-containing protein [Rubrivivax sp.]MDP3082224.1 DUF1992 domain-containing protein [Rubrivivax sp.]
MNAEDRRQQRLQLQDDEIGRALLAAERSGELRSAPSFGKPMNFGDGYSQTPEDLRMAYKMLKDAGFVPPEVEAMREIAALEQSIAGADDDLPSRAVRQRIADLRQQLALRLEKLRLSGSL